MSRGGATGKSLWKTPRNWRVGDYNVMPEHVLEDNLIEAETAEEQTTENPTEDVTEPIQSNFVEDEEDPALKNAGETFQAPGPDIPEGDPANLPDVPPGPKVDLWRNW